MFGGFRATIVGLGLAWVLAVSGCGLGPRVTLVVSLQTDLVPEIEFTHVRVTVRDEAEPPLSVSDRSFLEPSRVADVRTAPGTMRVNVQLLDRASQVVAERMIIADLTRSTGVVVFVSAQCRGVICPGEDDPCIDGVCTAASSVCGDRPCRLGTGPTCSGGECDDPEAFCPSGVCDHSCEVVEDCSTSTACGDLACISNVCVGAPRPGECVPPTYCAVYLGCVEVPPGTDGGVPTDAGPFHDGGPRRDGGGSSFDAGPDYDGGVGEQCACATTCGTLGSVDCEAGQPIAGRPCRPPQEICNDRDEDCDTRVDEGVDCSHRHLITCQAGLREQTDGTFVPNRVDHVSGGGPGLVCGGGVCQATIDNCQTLPAGLVPHTHSVTLGGGSLTIRDDVPFALSAVVGAAGGHTHGASCGIGNGSAEITTGSAFHRIRPRGEDVELEPVGRYDQFCVPPVGDPTTECRPDFLFCRTN